MSREGHCPHGNKLKRSTDINKPNKNIKPLMTNLFSKNHKKPHLSVGTSKTAWWGGLESFRRVYDKQPKPAILLTYLKAML